MEAGEEEEEEEGEEEEEEEILKAQKCYDIVEQIGFFFIAFRQDWSR